MHVPSSPGTTSRLTRRALLSAVGVGALGAIAGCNPFSSAPATITVTAGPSGIPPTTGAPATDGPSSSTALLGLVFTTRLHVEHLTAAITEDERDAELFADLLADRKVHLAALEAEYTRQFGSAAPGGSASSAPAPGSGSTGATTETAIADPDEVIGRIRGDATDAQSKFTDALASASRYQAELFGSIAACIATHRMVLS